MERNIFTMTARKTIRHDVHLVNVLVYFVGDITAMRRFIEIAKWIRNIEVWNDIMSWPNRCANDDFARFSSLKFSSVWYLRPICISITKQLLAKFLLSNQANAESSKLKNAKCVLLIRLWNFKLIIYLEFAMGIILSI